MDNLIYEFVDRVFTKMNKEDINEFRVHSPIWMEARRIYMKRLQSLTFNFYLTPDGFRYRIRSVGYDRVVRYPTFGAILRMDRRFIRITGADLVENLRTDYVQDSHVVENLSDLIRYISLFNLSHVEFRYAPHSAHCSFMEECAKNGLKTQILHMYYSPKAETFLKNQLHSEELQQLSLPGDWPSQFADNLEEFVCRPSFKNLTCNYKCLDMDCLKRIVGYWRAMENPWKLAEITAQTSRNLHNEFAAWLPFVPQSQPPEFRLENGDFTLSVLCTSIYFVLHFADKASTEENCYSLASIVCPTLLLASLRA